MRLELGFKFSSLGFGLSQLSLQVPIKFYKLPLPPRVFLLYVNLSIFSTNGFEASMPQSNNAEKNEVAGPIRNEDQLFISLL